MRRRWLVLGGVCLLVVSVYRVGRSATVLAPHYPGIDCGGAPTTTMTATTTTHHHNHHNQTERHSTNPSRPRRRRGTHNKNFVSGWTETTVVATLAFGGVADTKLLERLLSSLDANGRWEGRTAVLTDRADHYQDSLAALCREQEEELACDPRFWEKVSILPARPEDLRPFHPKTGKTVRFATESMRYKRFKTLLLDYLDDRYNDGKNLNSSDSSSSSYTHVLYLDAEIVVGRPITSLLQDYHDQMTQREVYSDEFQRLSDDVDASQSGEKPTNTTTMMIPPFMSFFSDCPKCARQNFNLNGGVFLLDRRKSRPCLTEWGNLFFLGDGTDHKYDQRYLVVMKQAWTAAHKKAKQQPPDYSSSSSLCRFFQLPDQHRLYPSRKDMRLKRTATIVHNTNTFGAQKIPLHLQQSYFSYLLHTDHFSRGDHLEVFR